MHRRWCPAGSPLAMFFLNAMRHMTACLALLLAGCGGGGGGSGNVSNAVIGASIPGDNVIALTVDNGPAGAGPQANRLYADVTVCQPGTSNCQTIDHVLVDTGSTGLRLIAAEVSSSLNLQANTSPATLGCQQFLDGSFAWGQVVSADVKLGGKTISNLPIQIMGALAYQGSSSTCSFGSAITSAIGTNGLGAKGILGVGISKEDCGVRLDCANNANIGYYYNTCTNGRCTGKTMPLAKQLQNPVYALSADNNGVVVVLPGLPSGTLSASRLTGSMVFGIGTQANNATTGTSAMPLTYNPSYVNTAVSRPGYSASMANSFLDTGSNGLYFGKSPSLPLSVCPAAIAFYCPTAATQFSATLSGSTGSARTFNFWVDPADGNNANALFFSGNPVLPTLAGPTGDSSQFIWGLPFFYGRTVFIGFENRNSVINGATVTGPFYAF
jgi:predicted aspartyl protease